MTLQEKLEFLEDIMDVEDALSEDMLLENIEEWDSLSVLLLITQMKKEFGIIISTSDIKGFKTVLDICQCIPD
mgnify:FL=1